MNEAWEKTVKHEAPINHSMEDIGDAMNPNGTATQSKPVYSCEVLIGPNGVIKSSPCNLLIPIIPPKTKMITNKSNRLVNRVYRDKQPMIKA